jgi:hypothetical protein
MMDSGRMIRLTDTAFILILMEPDIKATGRKISNMGKELRLGLMVQATKVTTLKEKNMVMESSPGLMEALMKGNFMKITSRVKECTSGLMVEFTKVNGKTTRWKEWEFLPGPMAANMRESISTIRRRAEEPSFGLTAESTMEIGKMENSMVSVFTLQPRAKPREESGMRAKESLG